VLLFRVLILLATVALAGLAGLSLSLPVELGVVPTAEEAESLRHLSAALLAAAAALVSLPGLRWPRLGLAVLGVSGLSLLLSLRPAPAFVHRPPDLILITLDTVRADAFSFVNGDVPAANTPQLTALAARGLVFRQAFSPAAITGPAHASLLSGLHPLTHGILLNGAPLPADLPWVPERLQEAGWYTEAWVSAAILEPSLGFGRGFSRYDSIFEDRLTAALPLWPAPERTGFSRPGAQTVAAALAAPRPADQKVFTWIHLYDAHWPYTPSQAAAQAEGLESNAALEPKGLSLVLNVQSAWSDAEQQRGRALYRAEVADVDAHVGEILAAAPQAAIVVVGDHGESLGEHGYLFNHGKLAFAPDTHVPLILSGPQLAPAVRDEVVDTTDVAATLLALAGLPAPAEMASRSLLSPQPPRPQLSVTLSEGESDSTFGSLSSVVMRESARSLGGSREHPIAAYQRAADPRELVPVAADGDDELRQSLESILAAEVSTIESSAEMEDALRALGYLE